MCGPQELKLKDPLSLSLSLSLFIIIPSVRPLFLSSHFIHLLSFLNYFEPTQDHIFMSFHRPNARQKTFEDMWGVLQMLIHDIFEERASQVRMTEIHSYATHIPNPHRINVVYKQ
jgi:hypothetical protein